MWSDFFFVHSVTLFSIAFSLFTFFLSGIARNTGIVVCALCVHVRPIKYLIFFLCQLGKKNTLKWTRWRRKSSAKNWKTEQQQFAIAGRCRIALVCVYFFFVYLFTCIALFSTVHFILFFVWVLFFWFCCRFKKCCLFEVWFSFYTFFTLRSTSPAHKHWYAVKIKSQTIQRMNKCQNTKISASKAESEKKINFFFSVALFPLRTRSPFPYTGQLINIMPPQSIYYLFRVLCYFILYCVRLICIDIAVSACLCCFRFNASDVSVSCCIRPIHPSFRIKQ